MPVKFVAEVLKGLFGTSEQSTDDAETETNITVERESDEESPEDGQEMTEESTDEPEDSEEPAESVEDTEEPAESVEDSEEPAESVEDSEEPAESVEEITGIGPTYGERLSAVGIETVGDLVGADETEVAEAAEVSESRAADWVTQAEDW
jgi:polyhydroxyalkanoate synthase